MVAALQEQIQNLQIENGRLKQQEEAQKEALLVQGLTAHEPAVRAMDSKPELRRDSQYFHMQEERRRREKEQLRREHEQWRRQELEEQLRQERQEHLSDGEHSMGEDQRHELEKPAFHEDSRNFRHTERPVLRASASSQNDQAVSNNRQMHGPTLTVFSSQLAKAKIPPLSQGLLAHKWNGECSSLMTFLQHFVAWTLEVNVNVVYALLLADNPYVPLAVIFRQPFPHDPVEDSLGDDPEANTQATRLHMRIVSGGAGRNCCSQEGISSSIAFLQKQGVCGKEDVSDSPYFQHCISQVNGAREDLQAKLLCMWDEEKHVAHLGNITTRQWFETHLHTTKMQVQASNERGVYPNHTMASSRAQWS